jgi:hypothetical protein
VLKRGCIASGAEDAIVVPVERKSGCVNWKRVSGVEDKRVIV